MSMLLIKIKLHTTSQLVYRKPLVYNKPNLGRLSHCWSATFCVLFIFNERPFPCSGLSEIYHPLQCLADFQTLLVNQLMS